MINDIGPTIGAHVGPGTLAIFFKKNINKYLNWWFKTANYLKSLQRRSFLMA